MALRDEYKFRKFITKDNIFWFYPILHRYFADKVDRYVFNKGISKQYSPHWDTNGVDLTLYGIELVNAHFSCGIDLNIVVDLDNDPIIRECSIEEYKKEYLRHREQANELNVETVKNHIADIIDILAKSYGADKYAFTDIRFIEDGERLVVDYSGYKICFNNLGGTWCWID